MTVYHLPFFYSLADEGGEGKMNVNEFLEIMLGANEDQPVQIKWIYNYITYITYNNIYILYNI